jgi:hypothetical protein
MRFGSTKRQKELARAQKQREKDSRRDDRVKEKAEREARPRTEGEDDPDLAGIIVGPQPRSDD